MAQHRLRTDSNLLLRTTREQGFKPAAILLVGTGDTFETLDALGAEYLEGVLRRLLSARRHRRGYGPGAAAYLAAYKAKYDRDPIAPQGMAAYVGMQDAARDDQAAGGRPTRRRCAPPPPSWTSR